MEAIGEETRGCGIRVSELLPGMCPGILRAAEDREDDRNRRSENHA
jgi:hypothetical protein